MLLFMGVKEKKKIPLLYNEPYLAKDSTMSRTACELHRWIVGDCFQHLIVCQYILGDTEITRGEYGQGEERTGRFCGYIR